MGRALLVVILGTLTTLAIVRLNFLDAINSGSRNAIKYYADSEARNIGNSMVNLLLTELAENQDYRSYESIEQKLIKGQVNYRIVDTVLNVGDTLIKVEVKVHFNEVDKTITAFTKEGDFAGWVPPFVRGAWTANANLNNTISDMYIDGRNYDLDLNIVPGTGTYGVSTSVNFENTENAAIGGTFNEIDYAMSYPENDNIIEENFDWGGDFPTTPDEILGYPEGTLKSIAQSGAEGSQYVLNPNKIEDELTFPLTGVTYVELTDGKDRDFKILGTGNKGILVVHGPGASSRLKGLKTKDKKLDKNKVLVCHKPGTKNEKTLEIDDSALQAHLDHGDFEGPCSTNEWFEGLIITDYSFHHHLDILGAILQLSPNLETEKHCNGNKDHWAYYSKQAIENATKITASESGLVGNSNMGLFNNEGFGNGRQKVLHWFE
jgi:hypothetical protein